MPDIPRQFSLDFNRGKIFGSITTETIYALKPFTAGDVEPFSINLVVASPDGLQLVTALGKTLQVILGSVGAPSSTVYTSVTLIPSTDGSALIGDLPLNIAAVLNLFASSSATQDATVEFRLLDGIYKQSISIATTIRQQVGSPTLQDTPLPDTAIGVIQATALFVPKVSDSAASPWQQIVNDIDGSGRQYRLYVSNGVQRCDPLS